MSPNYLYEFNMISYLHKVPPGRPHSGKVY